MGRPDEGDATNYQNQDIQDDLYTRSPTNDYPSYDQQQQQQQPQQMPPPQQQPQYNQANPNPNPQYIQPAYQAAPPHQAPMQFSPKSPQMNPGFPNQPTAYPPQIPPQMGPPAVYSPPQQGPQQTYPPPQVTPTPYPPPHPTMQQTAGGYAGMAHQPVQFPPPAPVAVEMQPQMPPASPMKPAQGIPMRGPLGTNSDGWNTGLFDCMDDPMNAIITFFFPCLTFGQVAEIVDKGQTSCGTSGLLYFLISSFIGMPCIYSCTYRTKLRSQFGLTEAPAPDWIVHFLCEPCALCQAYRELNMRGWDPAVGWMGNVQRNQYQQVQVMTPPTNQRMMG